jgi:hypothetical protein
MMHLSLPAGTNETLNHNEVHQRFNGSMVSSLSSPRWPIAHQTERCLGDLARLGVIYFYSENASSLNCIASVCGAIFYPKSCEK